VGRSAGEDEEGMEPDVLRGGETERTVAEEVAAGFGVDAGVGLGGGETSGGVGAVYIVLSQSAS